MTNNQGLIVIKKKKGGGHDGHHGGAWKVAYADFVTAMMAFFLLLWLLNVTTDEQKKGIADYFSPVIGVNTSNTGGQGMFQGESVIASRQLQTDPNQPTFSIEIPTVTLPEAETEESATPRATADEKLAYAEEAEETSRSTPKASLVDDPAAKTPEELDRQALDEAIAEREQEKFAEAEKELRQAIQEVPELRRLAQSLIIDQTPEGLRIQIVDQDKLSMFPLGSAQMYDHTRQLISKIATVVETMPNRISVTGHTDSVPYSNSAGYGNFELSSDRANASRRALIDAGIPKSRVAYVTGKADQEPLMPEDPTSPRNRRIGIIILRDQPIPETAAGPVAPRAAVPSQAGPTSPVSASPISGPADPAPVSGPRAAAGKPAP